MTKESTDNQEKLEQKKEDCKNCETAFEGKFCPNCGQSVYEFERSFRFLFFDFAGNLFAFDTRFWKSLIALIIHPGRYAADYIKGHRARYMPPFRFYVFVSFLFFLLFSIYLNKHVQISDEAIIELTSSLNEPIGTDSLEEDTLKTDEIDFNFEFGSDSTSASVYEEKLREAILMIINNPSLYMNNFLKFFSWSLFFLMPVYASYLWLFFRKTRKFYYSHIVFAINQHSFIFLLFIFLIVLKLLLPNREFQIENYLLWSIPIYMYLGYLKLYKRKWKTTLLRFLSILIIYGLTLAIALGITSFFWIKSDFL